MTIPEEDRKTGTMIEAYLARCRRRLNWIARARIAAGGIAAIATATLVFATAAAYLVPSQGWVVGTRILVYALAAATLAACIVRRVGARRAARRVERRVPAFDGRLVTWFDASRRGEPPALLPHLAAHAGRLAEQNPPRRAAPNWLFLPPLAVVAATALAVFVAFAVAPATLLLPAERLLLGDLLADTRPRIIVEPGDTVVPRGADVLLRARTHGFQAPRLVVNASFAGSGRWERANMLPSARTDFQEFVLVAVNEGVDYFISADGRSGQATGRFNSERFRIDVADLPVVESLELTLDYPEWTRLDSARQDHGDVAGVAGTHVRVAVEASMPLGDAHLVVNDQAQSLTDGTGEFVVDAPGAWHVAVVHRSQTVRISDQYLIDLVHDQPPAVEFSFPGRDRSATAIEEVVLRFSARDDFGVEALNLHYAVNGGEWNEVESPDADDREVSSSHTVFLEDLRLGEEQRPVRPGDVLALHAVARDHAQSTKSSLYFVDVRPYERHYRDTGTNDGGGAGGAGGGGREQELSTRQREIVNATWNLIQERDTGARAGSDLTDQVDLVGVLQHTLKDQVETLVARSEGRRLSADSEVEPYVAELTKAAVQMTLAAESLTRHELDEAVSPEQRAFQHLLTAEAGLRNVNVTLGSRTGSGDSVSRSLSELFDLEADPEQNRYESPNAGVGGQRGRCRRGGVASPDRACPASGGTRPRQRAQSNDQPVVALAARTAATRARRSARSAGRGSGAPRPKGATARFGRRRTGRRAGRTGRGEPPGRQSAAGSARHAR